MPEVIRWGHAALPVVLEVPDGGPVRLVSLGASGLGGGSRLPLAEVTTVASGNGRVRMRYADSELGARLRYVSHEATHDGDWWRLLVRQADPVSGLRVDVVLRSADGVPVVQAYTTVTNDSAARQILTSVTSLVYSGLSDVEEHGADLDVHWADSGWLAESRWHKAPWRRAVLPDVDTTKHEQDPRSAFGLTSHGGWPTGQFLPVGAVSHRRHGTTVMWQLEHNGAWHWQLGERCDGAYVALLGPTDTEHQWQQALDPGQSFTSVPAAIAVAENLDAAVAALTRYRRLSRRPHPDRERLPLVFNDFMNTLDGDPTTQKLLPLIDAAAATGAEYFCIDAGWYDSARDGWWDSVGEWEPSTTRFPGGLTEVLDRIRERGMVPGLWLEPEVVGVRSPLARRLPDDAFFQRHGVRLREHGRYHLDLRHPAAVAHLDAVVDRLVSEFGVGYLKLDYNINPGAGTDRDATSAGAGLLGHNRALLAWLDGVLDRHPGLVLESCASGAMRMDHATLSRVQLQSTSDQEQVLNYPPIAVAAPVMVPPEQAANWAYPQPEMTDEEIVFTLCTGLQGRLYLAGHLDRMSGDQLALVAEAVAAYRALRRDLPAAVPVWPLGLPGWDDPWLALGLTTARRTILTLWRRPGAPREVLVPLPASGGTPRVKPVFPARLDPWTVTWDPAAGALRVAASTDGPSARVLRVETRPA